MTLLKALIFIVLLFCSMPSFAQATDTTRRSDTSKVRTTVRTDSVAEIAAPDIVVDTVKKVVRDTVVKPYAGYIIHGKVVDMNTNEGIPFANVIFAHTSEGTAADLD